MSVGNTGRMFLLHELAENLQVFFVIGRSGLVYCLLLYPLEADHPAH